MESLQHPAVFHLRAAQGWLELGDWQEAKVELLQIPPALRRHPDVQEVRWQICARARKWERCVDIANALIRAVPDRASGWIHLSYSLHELQQTEDAYESLLGVVDDFPEEPVMRYNLACYSCQLGHLPEAMSWLRKAMNVGDPARLVSMALEDQDLKPLWNEIRGLVKSAED